MTSYTRGSSFPCVVGEGSRVQVDGSASRLTFSCPAFSTKDTDMCLSKVEAVETVSVTLSSQLSQQKTNVSGQKIATGLYIMYIRRRKSLINYVG